MSQTATIQLSDLPALGAALDGGTFAGLTTKHDGSHCAVVLLPDQGTGLNWQAAEAWAKNLNAELPTRPVAALLFANARDKLRPRWHWTCETHEDAASYAWYCYFSHGHQHNDRKSYEGCAVAVRLIPLAA